MLYLVTVVITLAVNVRLNNAIKAAGHRDRSADLTSVREQFNEARWAAWNLVRALTADGRVRLPRLGPRRVRGS